MLVSFFCLDFHHGAKARTNEKLMKILGAQDKPKGRVSGVEEDTSQKMVSLFISSIGVEIKLLRSLSGRMLLREIITRLVTYKFRLQVNKFWLADTFSCIPHSRLGFLACKKV